MVFVFDLNLNLSFYDHRISSSHFFSILYYTFFRWSILIILPLNMTTYVKNILCFDDIVYNITLKRDLISWIIRSTVWNMYCIVLYKVKVFIEHGLNKFSFTTSKGEWWLLVDHNSKCTQNSEYIFSIHQYLLKVIGIIKIKFCKRIISIFLLYEFITYMMDKL